MELLDYIQRGGIIVYVLIAMNIVGFTIIIWKSFVFFKIRNRLNEISEDIIKELNLSNKFEVEQVKTTVELKIKSLESGLNTIKIIASLSPLIGLLGTVVGILNSFDSITHLGLGDPTIFSSGISVALITTVAGLIVAIPHYAVYNYFMGSLDYIEIKLENLVFDNIEYN